MIQLVNLHVINKYKMIYYYMRKGKSIMMHVNFDEEKKTIFVHQKAFDLL